MNYENVLCLNLHIVREGMREKKLTKKEFGRRIGMKDPHTVAYYFEHPDKVKLSHITAIAKELESEPFQYVDYVIRVRNRHEFEKLVSGEDE